MTALTALLGLYGLAATLTGWRRGICREVIVTTLWLPAMAAVVVGGVQFSHDQAGLSDLAILKPLLGWYMAAVVVIWLVDISVIQPQLQRWWGPGWSGFGGLLGAVMGAARAVATVLLGMVLYSVYVSPLAETENPILQWLLPYSEKLEAYVLAHDYLPTPVVVEDYTGANTTAPDLYRQLWEDNLQQRLNLQGHFNVNE